MTVAARPARAGCGREGLHRPALGPLQDEQRVHELAWDSAKQRSAKRLFSDEEELGRIFETGTACTPAGLRGLLAVVEDIQSEVRRRGSRRPVRPAGS